MISSALLEVLGTVKVLVESPWGSQTLELMNPQGLVLGAEVLQAVPPQGLVPVAGVVVAPGLV